MPLCINQSVFLVFFRWLVLFLLSLADDLIWDPTVNWWPDTSVEGAWLPRCGPCSFSFIVIASFTIEVSRPWEKSESSFHTWCLLSSSSAPSIVLFYCYQWCAMCDQLGRKSVLKLVRVAEQMGEIKPVSTPSLLNGVNTYSIDFIFDVERERSDRGIGSKWQ